MIPHPRRFTLILSGPGPMGVIVHLDPDMHGQQIVSVIVCRNVREWLTKNNKRRIECHRCPSYEGAEWNERVMGKPSR